MLDFLQQTSARCALQSHLSADGCLKSIPSCRQAIVRFDS